MTLYSKTITHKLNSLQQRKERPTNVGCYGDKVVVTKKASNRTSGKKLKQKTTNRKKTTMKTTGIIRLNDLLINPVVFHQKSNSTDMDSCNPKTFLSMDDSLHAMLRRKQQPQIQEQRETSEKMKTTKQKNKRVHFATLATVTTIPCITKEDVATRWYNATDYKQFEENRVLAVEAIRWAIENGIYFNDTDGSVTLGLEHHISINAMLERKYRIYQHAFYVLKQQQYLKSRAGSVLIDNYDDQCETLRFVSELFSRGRIIVPQYQQQQLQQQQNQVDQHHSLINNMDRTRSWSGIKPSNNSASLYRNCGNNVNTITMTNTSPNTNIIEGQLCNQLPVVKLNIFD